MTVHGVMSYGDLVFQLTTDEPYSPLLADDLANVIKRTILETNDALTIPQPSGLTWNQAMRRDMQLDE